MGTSIGSKFRGTRFDSIMNANHPKYVWDASICPTGVDIPPANTAQMSKTDFEIYV